MPEPQVHSKLPERIRELRDERGLPRGRAAALLEPYTTESSWKSWENGGAPQFKYLLALARFFDVSLDYLIGWSDERGRAPKIGAGAGGDPAGERSEVSDEVASEGAALTEDRRPKRKRRGSTRRPES